MITLLGLFCFGVACVCLSGHRLGQPDDRVWPPWEHDRR